MAPPRTEDDYEDEGASDDDDVFIAVMGSTGSGKSSCQDWIESETIDVRCIKFVDEESGRKVILLDTPGFDDSRDGVTDTDILKMITDFLLKEYGNTRKLNGIIYIHSIASTRFSGQSGRNLKMFKNLCGAETYKNVVILTTFWDDNSATKMGEEREAKLKSKFCLQLAQGGAAFMRHNRTKSSAYKVLDYVFTLVPTDVQITKEIRVEGKTLEDTAAGSVHRAEVDALIAKHKAEVAELMNEMKAMRGATDEMKKELAKEKAEMHRSSRAGESCVQERIPLSEATQEMKKALAKEKAELNRLEQERVTTEEMKKELAKEKAELNRLEQERVALFEGLAGEQNARKALEDMLQQERVALSQRLAGEQNTRKALEDTLQHHKEERIKLEQDWNKRYEDQTKKHTTDLKNMERKFENRDKEASKTTARRAWRFR
ncbi:hypothetical protein D9757_014425 [Collybiopsis confluens]|uniref:G domain-containing protein n=1 Tax=Collybiopsis confluens TaxID=2823264 RepID=A0A8H5CQM2_9AGAR|nr:hypothetical protein D9757_014425 [Collybiopsis confluens]